MRESIRGGALAGPRQDCLTADGDSDTAGRSKHPALDLARVAGVALDSLPALARTIESEIIPRLMLMHHVPAARVIAEKHIGAEQVSDFTALILTQDTAVARAYLQSLVAAGTSTESIYLDLLSPTARRLGKLWEEDRCDFADVTIGLWRLQQLVHESEPGFRGDQASSGRGNRILLMPAPGEQHTFGLFMVSEFFLRAGWHVHAEPDASVGQLADLVSERWFDVAGFSVGVEARIEPLVKCIKTLRRRSRNAAIHVMVGGPIFLARPELVAVVGADGTAADAREAVRHAELVVGEKGQRC